MPHLKNRMKEKLLRGEAVLGCFCAIGSADIVEMLAVLGFDFVCVDCEHSAIPPHIAMDMYRAAELHGMSTITRIGENSQQVIQKFIDAGSGGVMIPLINTVEDAQRVVDAVKYPPIGKRGVAHARPAGLGYSDILSAKSPGDVLAQKMQWSNEETLVEIQIETKEAVENFDKIVRLPNIDILFFGRLDLAVSMAGFGSPGVTAETGGMNSPKITALVESLAKRAIEAGKIVGTSSSGLDDYKRWREKGFQVFSTSCARLLAQGPEKYLKDLRNYEKSR